jgi:hypothetical protein
MQPACQSQLHCILKCWSWLVEERIITCILFALLDCANHHDILTELSACVERSWVLWSLYYGVTESIVRYGQTGTQEIKQWYEHVAVLSCWVTPGRCFVISWSTYNWLTSQIHYLWELIILSPQFNCMISPYPDFPFRKYWHGFRFVCPAVRCCLLIDWW